MSDWRSGLGQISGLASDVEKHFDDYPRATKIGIVGNEAAKFTPATEAAARQLITELLSAPGVTHVVSGRCPLGGIDVWAEEIGKNLGLEPLIFPPKSRSWERGYKPRNIQIARHSDVVHVIVGQTLPADYTGMRFPEGCYHCGTGPEHHVKSGACWTARYAIRVFSKTAHWHVIPSSSI